MLAAIHLGIASPGLLHVPTFLLKNVAHVKPAFQMPTTKFAFGVLFIAGALSQLFDFDLMIR